MYAIYLSGTTAVKDNNLQVVINNYVDITIGLLEICDIVTVSYFAKLLYVLSS